MNPDYIQQHHTGIPKQESAEDRARAINELAIRADADSRLRRNDGKADDVQTAITELYNEKVQHYRSPLQQHISSVARASEARLRAAVRSLYFAGHWTCDTISEDEQKMLWEDLRDAAGIPPGHSP